MNSRPFLLSSYLQNSQPNRICASILATNPFFTSYLPQISGPLALVRSHISLGSRQRTQQRSTHTVVITNHFGQEMLTFDLKALGTGRSGATSMVSRTGSRGDSDEDDWIRITSTVGFAKEERQ